MTGDRPLTLTLSLKGRGDKSFAKQTYNCLPSNPPTFIPSNRRCAFTLAEVLVTLGIIGVVAALTLPSLIQNYKKHVVETRLQKFYSTMNQAIRLAEIDFGDKKYWHSTIFRDPEKEEEWFLKYFSPYMKILKTDIQTYHNKEQLVIYFPDGSILSPSYHSSIDWLFYTSEKCLKKYGDYSQGFGICSFVFNFNPMSKSQTFGCLYDKGFEPYSYHCLLPENTKNVCYGKQNSPDNSVSHRAWCTKAIQNNGWKIPDDYPYKVLY